MSIAATDQSAGTVRIARVGAESAADVHLVVAEAFGARPALDPPPAALSETPESIADALGAHGGVLATADGQAVGALVFERHDQLLGVTRFGVLPAAQGQGVAARMIEEAAAEAERQGLAGLSVVARVELPQTVAFWQRYGFAQVGRDDVLLRLVRLAERSFDVSTVEQTHDLARRLAALLSAGDLLILSGDLGAGKTTFTQGLGEALGVRGAITSPTFVIARVHPPLTDGPALVHVDAYRLGGIDELDDLDLDTSLDDAVTVVEWGEGVAEGLADDRLEIRIERSHGDEDDERRTLSLRPIGRRWAQTRLDSL